MSKSQVCKRFSEVDICVVVVVVVVRKVWYEFDVFRCSPVDSGLWFWVLDRESSRIESWCEFIASMTSQSCVMCDCSWARNASLVGIHGLSDCFSLFDIRTCCNPMEMLKFSRWVWPLWLSESEYTDVTKQNRKNLVHDWGWDRSYMYYYCMRNGDFRWESVLLIDIHIACQLILSTNASPDSPAAQKSHSRSIYLSYLRLSCKHNQPPYLVSWQSASLPFLTIQDLLVSFTFFLSAPSGTFSDSFLHLQSLYKQSVHLSPSFHSTIVPILWNGPTCSSNVKRLQKRRMGWEGVLKAYQSGMICLRLLFLPWLCFLLCICSVVPRDCNRLREQGSRRETRPEKHGWIMLKEAY